MKLQQVCWMGVVVVVVLLGGCPKSGSSTPAGAGADAGQTSAAHDAALADGGNAAGSSADSGRANGGSADSGSAHAGADAGSRDSGAADGGARTADAGSSGAAAACAGKKYLGSCQSTPPGTCIDFYEWNVASAMTACPAGQGTYSTTPCATAGNNGACEKLLPNTQACTETWYFGAYSTAIVMQSCKAPAVFHAP